MFFEFLPLAPSTPATVPPPAGATLLPHELQTGSEYELVVTNLGGLCRYRIGDVVRVVGFHGAAPLVEFRYRQGQLLNLRGEKTSEAALSSALRAAFASGRRQRCTAPEALTRTSTSTRRRRRCRRRGRHTIASTWSVQRALPRYPPPLA